MPATAKGTDYKQLKCQRRLLDGWTGSHMCPPVKTVSQLPVFVEQLNSRSLSALYMWDVEPVSKRATDPKVHSTMPAQNPIGRVSITIRPPNAKSVGDLSKKKRRSIGPREYDSYKGTILLSAVVR